MVVLLLVTPQVSPLRLASATYCVTFRSSSHTCPLRHLRHEAFLQIAVSLQSVASSEQVFFLTLDDEAVVELLPVTPHDSPLRLASLT